jgi:FkbM family methyltransferase
VRRFHSGVFKPHHLNSLSDHSDFTSTTVAEELRAKPLGYIDIGARGGTHDIVHPVARLTSVLAFEPDANECKRLLSMKEVLEPWAKFELQPIALAETNDEATLHILAEPNNHSLRPPNTSFINRYRMAKWTEQGTQRISTASLDGILSQTGPDDLAWGEFIKLDTQGTEFEILLGATKTLEERCVAVLTEVSFCELYEGQKLFSDVEHLLRKRGFSFYGFTSIHTRSRKFLDKRTHITAERALYSDAIFFKDPLSTSQARLTERQEKILFTVALLLNFYDFAFELAQETWLQNAESQERRKIERLIKKLAELLPTSSARAVEELAKEVQLLPELANLAVGNFVDRRRRVCNFDDILNISPAPKSL